MAQTGRYIQAQGAVREQVETQGYGARTVAAIRIVNALQIAHRCKTRSWKGRMRVRAEAADSGQVEKRAEQLTLRPVHALPSLHIAWPNWNPQNRPQRWRPQLGQPPVY